MIEFKISLSMYTYNSPFKRDKSRVLSDSERKTYDVFSSELKAIWEKSEEIHIILYMDVLITREKKIANYAL